jgi:hypothetical protein
MKFGLRTPSLRRSLSARTSLKRVVRHSLGLKPPRGLGWFANPRRAAYNRVYSRTTFSLTSLIKSHHQAHAVAAPSDAMESPASQIALTNGGSSRRRKGSRPVVESPVIRAAGDRTTAPGG